MGIPPAACYSDNMINSRSATDVLQWHIDAGADETIGETPVNRFQVVRASILPSPSVARPPHTGTSPPPQAKPRKQSNGPNGEEAVKSAYGLAAAAASVDELRDALGNFDGCALRKTATNLVFYNGNPKARLMFVGEAPGAQEDRQGEPFVGPSGALLDKMLASVGIGRADVLVSNTVFWRPPGNRTPTPQETAVCMPFMERLIELVDPDVLVTLGGPASKALLGETQGVGRLRGRWFTYETARMSHPIDATAMFHPAYLLRTPSQKRAAWSDLLGIQDKLAV